METHIINKTFITMYKHVYTHKNIDRYALLRSQAYALVNLYMHVYEVTCAKRRHHRRKQGTASQRKLWDNADENVVCEIAPILSPPQCPIRHAIIRPREWGKHSNIMTSSRRVTYRRLISDKTHYDKNEENVPIQWNVPTIFMKSGVPEINIR